MVTGANYFAKNGVEKLSMRIIYHLELERIQLCERGRHVEEDHENTKNTLYSKADDAVTLEYDGNTFKFPRGSMGDFVNCCFDSYHAVGYNLHLMTDIIKFLLEL
jgi:hypothetical protein